MMLPLHKLQYIVFNLRSEKPELYEENYYTILYFIYKY